MNTITTIAPEQLIRDPISTITPEQVAEWVHRKIDESGLTDVEFIIGSRQSRSVTFIVADHSDRDCPTRSSSVSFEAAVADFKGSIPTPEQKAADLKERAARLLAEAAEIEKGDNK